MNAITPKPRMFNLPPDDQFIVNQECKSAIYLVVAQHRLKVTVRDLVSGETAEISKQEIYEWWKAGQVTFLSRYHQTEAFSADTKTKTAAAFVALPDDVKRAALIRQDIMHHLAEIRDQDGVIKNPVLQLISDRAEQEHPGVEGLSRSALREYLAGLEPVGARYHVPDRYPREKAQIRSAAGQGGDRAVRSGHQ